MAVSISPGLSEHAAATMSGAMSSPRVSGCGGVKRAPTSEPPSLIRSSRTSRPSPRTRAARRPARPWLLPARARTKAVPTLGCPANGISARGVKIRTCAVCAAILRRQHESRLGEIELAGDGLHLRGRQAAAVEARRRADCRRISFGEDVDGDKFKLHGSPGVVLGASRIEPPSCCRRRPRRRRVRRPSAYRHRMTERRRPPHRRVLRPAAGRATAPSALHNRVVGSPI